MGDRLGIPRVVDSSSLYLFFFNACTRAPALTRAAEPPAFWILSAFFCFFQFYTSVSLLGLLSKRSKSVVFSRPPFFFESSLRVFSVSLFEPSTSQHKVWNYSPVGAGNALLFTSSHPPPSGLVSLGSRNACFSTWLSLAGALSSPSGPLSSLVFPWPRFVHWALCPRAGFYWIVLLVHVSVASRPETLLSYSGRPRIYFFSLLMAIPFANRKAWAELPEIALRDKPTFTLAEIHGEFNKVLHVSLESVFECIQVVSRTKLCLTFKDKNALEETANIGLEFRGHPITLTPLHTKTWVSVSRVQFGVPWDSVKAALAPYGHIDRARYESLNNICTGTISVLMQVTTPIPSKLTIAGRTCFIYYRGQPRTCFGCGEPGHQKRDCPRSANRVEINNALARSSTWGSQAHSGEHTTSTDPPGNPPVASSEQPVATIDGLLPDPVSAYGSIATDPVPIGSDTLVVAPPGPSGLASGQQSDAVILPAPEPMEGASSGDGVTFVPGDNLTPPVITSPAIVGTSGEQFTTEVTLPLVPLHSTEPSGISIVLPEEVLSPSGETTLPPQDALAVLSKLVQSCGDPSGPSNLPMDTMLPSASDIQSESLPNITVLEETIPPYEETGSTNTDHNDHVPEDLMDLSQSSTGPLAVETNSSRVAHLRVADIDLSQPDFGIGPGQQWERNQSGKNKNKRLRKNAQSSRIATESASSGPCVRTRTRPSVPPNPNNRSANSFDILTDHPTTDLSETVHDERIPPASPTVIDQFSSDPWVPVFSGTGSPVASDCNSSGDESVSSESEEVYTPILTASGNLLPIVSRPAGPSIPNPPLPDSESSLSSVHEDSDVERPGS